jgi:hypothetical protein
MKYENLIDLGNLKHTAEGWKDELRKNVPPEVGEALNIFLTEKTTRVYIFLNSITFRNGRSSVQIKDNTTSTKKKFKATFKTSNQEMFDSKTFSGPSHLSKVVRFALLAILEDPKRVQRESDKTEKQETIVAANAVRKIQELMDKTDGDFITLKMGDMTFRVDGFRQVWGRPKTDMTFTYKGQDVVFISHKYGEGTVNVQQYGGFANDLGMERNSRLNFHPYLKRGKGQQEIPKFLTNIDRILDANYPGARDSKDGLFDFSMTDPGGFAVPVESREIAELVMFGREFGSQFFGMNNAHVLIDGEIILEKEVEGVYTLRGSSHTVYNPRIKGLKHDQLADLKSLGKYQPMLMVARSGQQRLKQGGFKNARAYVWPNNEVASRYYKRYVQMLNSL